jgi:hypothetical protein
MVYRLVEVKNASPYDKDETQLCLSIRRLVLAILHLEDSYHMQLSLMLQSKLST